MANPEWDNYEPIEERIRRVKQELIRLDEYYHGKFYKVMLAFHEVQEQLRTEREDNG